MYTYTVNVVKCVIVVFNRALRGPQHIVNAVLCIEKLQFTVAVSSLHAGGSNRSSCKTGTFCTGVFLGCSSR